MRRLICLLLCLALVGCSAAPEETTDAAQTPIRIAVIDTGFSGAIAEQSVAPGANYVDPEASTEDTYGHGTAVASVILRDAPQAILVPLVCTSYAKGKLTQLSAEVLAQIIRDAVDVYHCQIINISAGFQTDADAVRSAVEYAEQKSVLIVAAAGNDYGTHPDQIYYPAAYPTVLSVGALNKEGTAIADFSQRGDWVDMYAPGQEVAVLTLSGKTTTDFGTSYAAAAVSAMAAQRLGEDPTLEPAQLRAALTERTP